MCNVVASQPPVNVLEWWSLRSTETKRNTYPGRSGSRQVALSQVTFININPAGGWAIVAWGPPNGEVKYKFVRDVDNGWVYDGWRRWSRCTMQRSRQNLARGLEMTMEELEFKQALLKEFYAHVRHMQTLRWAYLSTYLASVGALIALYFSEAEKVSKSQGLCIVFAVGMLGLGWFIAYRIYRYTKVIAKDLGTIRELRGLSNQGVVNGGLAEVFFVAVTTTGSMLFAIFGHLLVGG